MKPFTFKLLSKKHFQCNCSKISFTYDCNLDRYRVEYYYTNYNINNYNNSSNIGSKDGVNVNEMNHTEFRQWRTCVTQAENIFRNVELDWRMCYLARNKYSQPDDVGRIVWRFEEEEEKEAGEQNLRKIIQKPWKTIEIRIEGGVFESGKVTLEFRMISSPSSSTISNSSSNFTAIIEKHLNLVKFYLFNVKKF